jgi:hypothetical protein
MNKQSTSNRDLSWSDSEGEKELPIETSMKLNAPLNFFVVNKHISTVETKGQNPLKGDLSWTDSEEESE